MHETRDCCDISAAGLVTVTYTSTHRQENLWYLKNRNCSDFQRLSLLASWPQTTLSLSGTSCTLAVLAGRAKRLTINH